MVIQSYMLISAIYEAWPETKDVFDRYGLQHTSTESLKDSVPDDVVELLIDDLNKRIGSTDETCFDGG